MIDLEAVKRDNEAIIRRHGGQTCDWLPSPDPEARPRGVSAVARRALVMNAVLQIALNAPIPIINQWIRSNGLADFLSDSERAILAKSGEELTRQEQVNLLWYVESLWALAWAGGLIDQMSFDEPVGDVLASLSPDLQRNEDGSKFLEHMRLRPHEELFRMLDLYYRLHWWTTDAQLRGQPTGDVSINVVVERRRALEWILDAEVEWDDVEMST